MKLCEVESCNKEAKMLGFCYQHYKRFKRIGTTELHPRLCNVEGCEEKHGAKGMCTKHYSQVKREEDRAALKQPIIYKNGNWKVQDESDYVPIKK